MRIWKDWGRDSQNEKKVVYGFSIFREKALQQTFIIGLYDISLKLFKMWSPRNSFKHSDIDYTF